MLQIKKGKEPKALQEYRCQGGKKFDEMKCKGELRSALLKEQGYLCAYCMKRIHDNSNEVRIEHYEKRTPQNEVEYNNLFATCSGGYGGDPRRFTCDNKKGDRKLHIDPRKKEDIDTITYLQTGEIQSSNEDFQKDFDDILNLNDPYGFLIPGRKTALLTVKKRLSNYGKKGNDQHVRTQAKKILENYRSKNAKGAYPEYAGIIIWYLERKMTQWEGQK